VGSEIRCLPHVDDDRLNDTKDSNDIIEAGRRILPVMLWANFVTAGAR
jgi:hypothetical protein